MSVRKLELSDHGIGVEVKEFEDSEIPSNLAIMTMTILRLHAGNGDLGYVKDLMKEFEAKARQVAY